MSKKALARQTQSQPSSKSTTLPSGPAGFGKKHKADKKSQKHLRAKSVPSPLHVGGAKGSGDAPLSPTPDTSLSDRLKTDSKKSSSSASGGGGSGGGGSGGSPKPRRNLFEGFKNTLRPKAKSQDSSKNSESTAAAKGRDSSQTATLLPGDSCGLGGSSGGDPYANMPQSAPAVASAEAGAEGLNKTDISPSQSSSSAATPAAEGGSGPLVSDPQTTTALVSTKL